MKIRNGLAQCKTIDQSEQEAQNMVTELAAEVEKGFSGKNFNSAQRAEIKDWLCSFMLDFQFHLESEIEERKHLRPFPLAIAAIREEMGYSGAVQYLLQKWKNEDAK